MKLSKFIVLIITSLVLTSCGSKTGDVPAPKSEYIPYSYEPVEHTAFNQNVDATGGKVKDPENNLTIDIPAGALDNETNISALYVEYPEYICKDLPCDFLGAA